MEAPWESSDYSGELKGLNWQDTESLARASGLAWNGHLTRRLRVMQNRQLVLARRRAKQKSDADAYNRKHGFST